MISQEKSRFPDWRIVLIWGFVTTIGLVISDGIQAYFVPPNSLLGFFIPGITIGILQWWYLSRFNLTQGYSWLLATVSGWLFGYFFGALAGAFINLIVSAINNTLSEGDTINAGSNLIGGIAQAVFHSAILAMFQWAFFMRKKFDGAIWWIPVTVLGWSLSIFIGWVIIPVIAQFIGWEESGFEDSTIRGMIFGLITGWTIQWLTKHPLSEKHVPTIVIDNIS